MENPTHSFRETNLVLQLPCTTIKSETAISWSSRKKKFSTVYFVRECTNFYTSKNITSFTFLLVLEIVESLQCILKALLLGVLIKWLNG